MSPERSCPSDSYRNRKGRVSALLPRGLLSGAEEQEGLITFSLVLGLSCPWPGGGRNVLFTAPPAGEEAGVRCSLVHEAQHTYLCLLRGRGREWGRVGGTAAEAPWQGSEDPRESSVGFFPPLPLCTRFSILTPGRSRAFRLCVQGFGHLSQGMALACVLYLILGSLCTAQHLPF